MLDDDNINEVGDGGTSDAEGDGYECVISFKDGMKKMELELGQKSLLKLTREVKYTCLVEATRASYLL